jgi:hypothetical protein
LRIETQLSLPWFRRTGAILGLLAIAVMPAACTSGPVNQSAQTNPTYPAGATASSASASSPLAAAPTVATQSPTPVPSSAPPKPTIAAAPVHTQPAPVHTVKAPPPPPKPVQTIAQPQGCYPKASSGNCYKPGEYCSDDDHGKSGIDAEGDAIKCEDNDGWRWERA